MHLISKFNLLASAIFLLGSAAHASTLSEEFEAIHQTAVSLAGAPGDIPERVQVLRQI